MIAIAIVIAALIIAVPFVAIINYLRSISMDVQTLLNSIATISTELDALIAAVKPPAPPVDLQPVADALTVLGDKVRNATPAP